MAFVLNEFVEGTKILPSKVNENFEGLQGDISDNYTELDGRMDTFDTTLENIQENLSEVASVPTGTVIWFAGGSAPSGYLYCYGVAVSRTDFADLFAVIGTTYGAGDGSTTFNLPNLANRFIEGGTPGTYISAGLPNITGSIALGAMTGERYPLPASDPVGALGYISQSQVTAATATIGPGQFGGGLTFNAAASNGIYGNSNTVQPAALAMIPCIKY